MGIKDRDPYEIFESWLAKASRSEVNNPNAMTLATADKDGRPAARMVLLKDGGPHGFVFYTNLDSPKCHQLREIHTRRFYSIGKHWIGRFASRGL